MASFEQNQQNQFNMNNSLDQVKQFQAELDKATTAIGAAELEAEEELLGVKLKNLTKAQQTKLTQLGQLLKLEEDGIQELAKLKLTLSNRQFAIRKKEIQKEFQLYKAAAEELIKAESKRKAQTQGNTSKNGSSTADAAIQKANRKVLNAEYAVDQVNKEITNTISALQEISQTASKAAQAKVKSQAEQKPATTTKQDTTQQGTQPVTPKVTDNSYGNGGLSYDDKVDVGKFGFESIIPAIGQLTTAKNTEVSSIVGILETIKKTGDEKGQESVSKATLGLAGELVKITKETEDTIAKVREFNENKAQNMRLVQLAAEQNLANSHAEAEYNERIAKINAYAKKRDILLNKDMYLAEAENKLRIGHINKENELRLAGIAEEAKAKNIQNNKATYELEARLALENDLAAKKNDLAEDLIKKEEKLKFTAAHRDELLANRKAERENKYLDEYNDHLLEAGDYAISLEEYKADQERKRQKAAKKEAVGGMTAGLKKFGTGEFSMADVQQSYTKYMGQRTAELNTFNREKYLEDLKKQNPGISDKDAQKAADAEAKKAKASAELSAQFELLAEAAGNLMDALDANVRKIADMQGFIDTRLQGSRENELYNLSYGKQLLREAKWIAGASPYIKQEKLVDNIKTLVDKGISFDVKQRAFLMTIQEKIANTFSVADGTLLRLIRIQQQDTTAGRLGMESALNSFLNSMYETSEYLESVAAGVRGSLEELQALMDGKAATEIEYQVQKWMGSLYSVGMSDSAIQDIAKTFGQVVSGDISGLAGSGTGNLLIMAANEAGMSIADILQEGLDADETNKLMQAMVNYLAEIAETSSDSRVVQQQLANVYGLKASDLRAATNLSSSLKDVVKADMSYSGMMGQLNLMMNTIGLRTSVSEGMTNMWDNIMYSMASTQASNPILYLLPKMANLLKDVTGGGIALPFLNVMGFGVDLNTSVADLMMVASMAGTALGALGPVLAGLADLGNPLAGSAMMMRAGINPFGKVPVLARGSAPVLQTLGGSSISESGYVGNASGDDIKKATLQDAEDSKKKQMVEAKENETADDIAMKADLAVVDIYNLLEEVAHGSQSLRVRVINGPNGAGSSGVGGSYGGGTSSNQTTIGDSTGAGTTSGGSGAGGVFGTDNGNWVLAF